MNDFFDKHNFNQMPFKTATSKKHRFEGLSNKIIGAAIEVHSALGPGFMENIYEEALKVEFSEHDLNYQSQKEVKIEYLGVQIGTHRLDLVVENQIIIEFNINPRIFFCILLV